jgi:hypothetical protein
MTWLVMALLAASPDEGAPNLVECLATFSNGMEVRAWISPFTVTCKGTDGNRVYQGKHGKDLCSVPSEGAPPLTVSRAGFLTIPPMRPIPMECRESTGSVPKS